MYFCLHFCCAKMYFCLHFCCAKMYFCLHFCCAKMFNKMFKQKVLTTNFCNAPILARQLSLHFLPPGPPIRIGTTQNVYTVACANCFTFCYAKWPCQNAFLHRAKMFTPCALWAIARSAMLFYQVKLVLHFASLVFCYEKNIAQLSKNFVKNVRKLCSKNHILNFLKNTFVRC